MSFVRNVFAVQIFFLTVTMAAAALADVATCRTHGNQAHSTSRRASIGIEYYSSYSSILIARHSRHSSKNMDAFGLRVFNSNLGTS